MKKIKSGIEGLDEIAGGGIPKNDIILLSGVCGAGKTIFGLQFLYKSAEKEPGIYVSFEEEPEQIKEAAMAFGWDMSGLEKRNKIRFLKYDPFKMEDIFEIIESNIIDIGAQRVVIDSLSALGIYMKDITEVRRMMVQTSSILRKNNCTSVFISEILPEKRNAISRFGVEEFVTDGVIVMHHSLLGGEYRRGVSVWKMRASNHSKKIHPYKINESGLVVYPNDTFVFREER